MARAWIRILDVGSKVCWHGSKRKSDPDPALIGHVHIGTANGRDGCLVGLIDKVSECGAENVTSTMLRSVKYSLVSSVGFLYLLILL